MNAATVRLILKALTDKRTWKIVGSVFVVVVLFATAIGTSCTAHNLQTYAADKVAADFAPLVSSVQSEMDGQQLDTQLLYAAYITLFDTQKYQDKDTVRGKLIQCFYTETTRKVEATDEDGNPVLDSDGHKTYYEETVAVPVSDASKVFDKIEREFRIQIDDAERQYIQNLSVMLVNYNSISISDGARAYQNAVNQYCAQYGIPDYTSLVLAVIQQESGGSGTDPMQCSESPYNTKYPHSPNSITDPNYSIDTGTKYLASCIKAAKAKSSQDIPGISLALQGYNFGSGYIKWAQAKGGYTQQNAQEFSQLQASKLGWDSYGDVNYVSHVLRYYSATGSTETGVFSYPIQVGKYTISSPFGFRIDPTTGKPKNHNGVDFAAAGGTPIYASESGTVTFADFGISGGGYGGYGNVVVISHASSLVSLYGHCSRLLVSTGQTVKKGQVVALVGSTGDSTGNHCHFEIRKNGKAVNPMDYLR